MRLADRTRLLQRSQFQAEELYPATLTFPGFAPFAASRRGSLQTQALRFGGVTDSGPVVFLVARANLPAGLVLELQKTTFLDGSTSCRVVALDDEPSEPQVRITADLSGR